MDSALQLLGSVASLFSIPLAIYLFLRSREAQFRRVRGEIARNLSYQIGDGRTLRSFEIQAVIDSECRQNRIPRGRIRGNEIIEDLVTDTIRNPMIASDRKQEILDNLRTVYDYSSIINVYPELREITEREAAELISANDLQKKIIGATRDKISLLPSTVFMSVFTTLTLALLVVAYFFPSLYFYRVDSLSPGTQIVLGLLTSGTLAVIATAVSFLYKKLFLSK